MQSISPLIDPVLLSILRCPISKQPLHVDNDKLSTTDGMFCYPVIEGIPLLLPQADSTHSGYDDILVENSRQVLGVNDNESNKFIEEMIVPTCGNLFHNVRLNNDYPIPDFPEDLGVTPFPLLDIGCNWGRWSIAAAIAKHKVVGVDIHLKSLLCAKNLAQRITPGNVPFFVLADARYLPFDDKSFGCTFSYSVIQHFSKDNAALILKEISRVMKPRGNSLIQMPNKSGLRALLTLGAQRHAEGSEFDVRRYSIDDLLSLFERQIGRSDWSVDCFLGLNVHARDLRFVPADKKLIIYVAEILLGASRVLPVLAHLADSVFIKSEKT